MDDKPAIEYHPFGTITLNFDDGPVKLRRCRLGDLQYAKDLLEEIRVESAPKYDELVAEVNQLREANADQPADGDARASFRELAKLVDKGATLRQDDFYRWISEVITRMGDKPAPPKEEWPVEIFRTNPITQDDPQGGRIVAVADILNHWQSRPLASGKVSQNGMTPEAAISVPSKAEPSSPPAPQPQ